MSIHQRLPESRTPIEPNRRLVDSNSERQDGIEEYYDTLLEQRIIVLPTDGEDAALHGRLIEGRVPVFSALYNTKGECQLQVSAGASRLSQILKFIPRDMAGYSFIFEELGMVLGKVEQGDFGALLPRSTRGVLDAVAFAGSSEPEAGGSVLLIPPYEFHADDVAHGTIARVGQELAESDYFAHEQIAFLLGRVRTGVENR